MVDCPRCLKIVARRERDANRSETVEKTEEAFAAAVAKCVAFRALMFKGLDGDVLARMHEVTLTIIGEELAPALLSGHTDLMDDLVPATLKAEKTVER